MRRVALSPLTVMLVLMLAAVVPQQAFGPPSRQAGQAPAPSRRSRPGAPAHQIPLDLFQVPDGFEVTLWAARRCCTTRPTSTSIETGASGWPKAFATARITPASPKAIASSSCRTPTATARPTARTRSCRNRR